MNLIFAILMYPLLPLLHWQMKNEAKPKKNIVLGVTLPYTALQEAAVLEMRAAYEKAMRRALLFSHLLLLPLPLLHEKSVLLFSALLMWMLAVMLLYHALYIRYHNRLRLWKLERGLRGEAGAAVHVDTRAIAQAPAHRGPQAYLPALLLSLVPFAWEALAPAAAMGGYAALLSGGNALLLLGLLFWVDRTMQRRSDAASSQSEINAVLTQARRSQWRRCCLYSGYLAGVFGLLLYMMLRGVIGALWGTLCLCLYVFVQLYIVYRCEAACRRVQERLAGALETPVDTDAYWPWGMFYYNPDDKRLLVHSRVGLGSTFNLARPAGKAVAGFALLCLLSIPLTAVWLLGGESAPVEVSITEDTLFISHGWSEKALPVSEIEQIETLEVLPRSVRVAGTGLETLRKGRFTMAGYPESCYFCLNPQAPPFVTFLCEGTRYVLNKKDAAALWALPRQAG